MPNHYFETLEINPDASQLEIKQAFRRLSKEFHPDVNKDPDAVSRFIAIKEAYEYLSNEKDSNLDDLLYDNNTEQDEYQLWKEEVIRNRKQQERELALQKVRLLKKIERIIKYPVILILSINIILALDYFLPKRTSTERVLTISDAYERDYETRKFEKAYFEMDFENHTLLLDRDAKIILNATSLPKIKSTYILDRPISVSILHDGENFIFTQPYSLYTVFGYIIPLILLSNIFYWIIIKSSDYRISIFMLQFATFLIQLYFFL